MSQARIAALQARADKYPADAVERLARTRGWIRFAAWPIYTTARLLYRFICWRIYCLTTADTPARRLTIGQRQLWAGIIIIGLSLSLSGTWWLIPTCAAQACLLAGLGNIGWADGYRARNREPRIVITPDDLADLVARTNRTHPNGGTQL